MIVLFQSGVQQKMIIQDKLMKSLDNTNPIFMMSDSGARGNASNFTQLSRYAWTNGQPGWTYYRVTDYLKFP